VILLDNSKLPGLSHHDVKVHVQVDRAGDAVIVVEELFPFHLFHWLKFLFVIEIARGSVKHCMYWQHIKKYHEII
jgi:hypothetical protein